MLEGVKSPDSFWWILNSIQNIYKAIEGYDKNIYKYLGHIVHAFYIIDVIGGNIINIPDEQLAQLIEIDVESILADDLRTYVNNKNTNKDKRYQETCFSYLI